MTGARMTFPGGYGEPIRLEYKPYRLFADIYGPIGSEALIARQRYMCNVMQVFVNLDVFQLEYYKYPKLIDSGIRYERKPDPHHFFDANTMHLTRMADCKDFAAYLTAEILNLNMKAAPWLTWGGNENEDLHACVHVPLGGIPAYLIKYDREHKRLRGIYPAPVNDPGWIIDPSRWLGMI